MSRRVFAAILLALLIIGCKNPLGPKTGTLKGTVKDAGGKAVSGAVVKAGDKSATTDASGTFSFELEIGDYELSASKSGYNSWKKGVSVSQGGFMNCKSGETTVDIVLTTGSDTGGGTGGGGTGGGGSSASKDVSEMITVPAGTFTMGGDNYPNEQPIHKVYLDAYQIDKNEVTNARYKVFMDSGGYGNQSYWTPEGWEWKKSNNITEPNTWSTGEFNTGPNYPDHPVEGVSWYEAYAFAKWAGKRLPTEAEWEKAATGTDGRTFPWGKTYNEANVGGSRRTESSKVGSYPTGASPYGCLDMAGNAGEWVNDWFQADYYSVSPASNPKGPATGEKKPWRGGTWCYYCYGYVQVRCAIRYTSTPDTRSRGGMKKGELKSDIGFRCAK